MTNWISHTQIPVVTFKLDDPDMDLHKAAVRVSVDGSSNKYFHLSRRNLGDEFTFTPSVPDDAYKSDYGDEDFTTERVSLAPSVEAALDSLPDPSGKKFVYMVEDAEVYAPQPLPEYFLDDPSDTYWNWGDYADWKGLDYEDEKAHAETVRGRIPDPETGEVWSLKAITMKLVGETNEDGSINYYD